MQDACLLKLLQNKDAALYLLSTGTAILAETSMNRTWGIGMSAAAARGVPPEQWPGQNRLGEVLHWVRAELKARQQHGAPIHQHRVAAAVDATPLPSPIDDSIATLRPLVLTVPELPSLSCGSQPESASDINLLQNVRSGEVLAIGKHIQLSLILGVSCQGIRKELKVLLDTGAQASLICANLFPDHCFKEAKRPIKLCGANGGLVKGGVTYMLADLEFGLDAGVTVVPHIQANLYAA
jgi:hypothetical protein